MWIDRSTDKTVRAEPVQRALLRIYARVRKPLQLFHANLQTRRAGCLRPPAPDTRSWHQSAYARAPTVDRTQDRMAAQST